MPCLFLLKILRKTGSAVLASLFVAKNIPEQKQQRKPQLLFVALRTLIFNGFGNLGFCRDGFLRGFIEFSITYREECFFDDLV